MTIILQVLKSMIVKPQKSYRWQETVEKKPIIKLTTCGYINNSFIHNIAGSFVFII